MLFELSIIPVGGDAHMSDEIAEVLQIVSESGLPYQMTPSGTCIEGDWDEVMALVRTCHDQVRKHVPHVITTIKVEDEAGAKNQLVQNVASVAQKADRPVSRA